MRSLTFCLWSLPRAPGGSESRYVEGACCTWTLSQHQALSSSPVLQVVQPINGDPFIGMLEVGVMPTIFYPRLPVNLNALAGPGPSACKAHRHADSVAPLTVAAIPQTPVTSSPVVAGFLSNLPAYRIGVSPLLRGVEIGLVHGFLAAGQHPSPCGRALAPACFLSAPVACVKQSRSVPRHLKSHSCLGLPRLQLSEVGAQGLALQACTAAPEAQSAGVAPTRMPLPGLTWGGVAARPGAGPFIKFSPLRKRARRGGASVAAFAWNSKKP